MTTKTKNVKEKSKDLVITKKENENIVINANVLNQSIALIAIRLNDAQLLDYAHLSFKQCIELNATLIKKEKHYFPKNVISANDCKAYRNNNRSKLKNFIVKKVIQNKFVGTDTDLKAIANFILVKYNINILTIDCNTFDYSNIYRNDEFAQCAKIAFLAYQKSKAIKK